MRCLVCGALSWRVVCKGCKELLCPTLRRRRVGDFEVVSFYGYSEIEPLLLTKHHYIGHRVFKFFAQEVLAPFARSLELQAFVVPIDDRLTPYYAHTALLARGMATKSLKPSFYTLLAQNRVSYSGKSLAFRREHPRDFLYRGPRGDVILVDDIITTGATMKEAYEAVKKAGANPLFGVVLADAKR